jgi:outer membrane protein assembly factor BamD
MKASTIRTILLLTMVGFLSAGTSGCLFFGGKKKAPLAGMKAAPDKVLYENALNDIQHSRYTEGRLTLQTLINTYPDSEYLAKAKLAIADSYYKQGGVQGLTEAVAEYKDFITFFPFLSEASFAQYRAAMGHFRMMEKPDRDRTQALEAEAELQTMILKYPKSQWTADAKQRLREVQQVLAEGDFAIASFYDLRGAYGAAAARLLELTSRYPLFSEADQANMLLAKIYEKTEHNEFAARFYENVVREYPLSPLVPDAKKRLVALGYPVPQADPKALARMKDEEKFIKDRPGIVHEALGMLKSGPDVSRAAHYGQPNLTPETDIISARQVLEPSVVSMAVNSASQEVGNRISVSTVPSSGGASFGTSNLDPTAMSVVAGPKDSSGGNGLTGAPVGKAQAQEMKDPAKGPQEKPTKDLVPAQQKTQKPDEKGKDSKKKEKKKKKKGLLHKVIPF